MLDRQEILNRQLQTYLFLAQILDLRGYSEQALSYTKQAEKMLRMVNMNNKPVLRLVG